ncbi:MAG: hypothetical protein R3A80_12915 [Bdellovibrionota bacterium]
MSLTQKRLLQFPLLFLIIFLVILPLEWTVFSQLPFYLGPFNFLSILITYIALTRSLAQTLVWGLVGGLISSLLYPFGFGAIIAAFAWSAMAAKLMTYALPFDSRVPFAALVCYQIAFCKILWRLLTLHTYHGIGWLDYILKNIPSFFTSGIIAFIALPFFVVWDEFFENNSPKSSDLKPSIMGMRR